MSTASLDRRPPARTPRPTAEPHADAGTGVRAEGLVVHRGGERALDGATCWLPAGAVTALVGGNGSGKSTLLEALAGLAPAAAGTIAGLPAARALVVQRTDAGDRLPLTGRQAVAMGLWGERGMLGRLGAAGRRRVEEALAQVGAEHLADRQLSAMSGGQRQRVLVAQGLVQRAPLLLLDEPGSAADDASRDRIDDALAAAAAEGAVVVVATHDRRSLARADRAVLLDHGLVVAEGAPEAVAAAQAARAAAALAPAAAEAQRGGAVEARTTSSGA
ncbi:metal ABC transporter ATP-binding protein [Agrococcus terreus]|uniref:ABC transporter domain-containing protein n=1 Tax=Agrococcus terreus TaxID=574649 RepID=A0ABQ2K9R1_9MICO|nr:ATP-binding cassette domain-containing protein [Agrococcus terreus]GGN76855.1 hypothetical protein GCM10010968_00700 [Agrococcus terreus]